MEHTSPIRAMSGFPTNPMLADAEAAVAAEIQRLRDYLAAGAPKVPLDIRFEHVDLDDHMAFVTCDGNDSPVSSVCRVAWHRERELEGDLEVGKPYPVIEELQVWAAVDGPGLPWRDITGLLSEAALAEARAKCEERLEGRLRDREAA